MAKRSDMKPLISLSTVPKSGSSLIAGIFHVHGVWVGKHEIRRMSKTPLDYPSFENEYINQWVKQNNSNPKELLNYIKNVIPNNSFWLYKASLSHVKKVTEIIKPSHEFKVERSVDGIMASTADYKREWRMEQVKALKKINIHAINSSEIISGNLTSIIEALEKCGFAANKSLIKSCIDRSRWNHA